MGGKEKIYNLLVNRVPGIRDRYCRKRSRAGGIRIIGVWFYLLGMNISYYALRNRSLAEAGEDPEDEKEVRRKEPEAPDDSHIPPEQFAKQLVGYDVISFDVFDTLVRRPFSRPTDLFDLLGERITCPRFKEIRREMEWQAREKKYKKEKHREVTLPEIYAQLPRETGLDRDMVMGLEAELEQEVCYGDPYMQQVVRLLAMEKKRLIITSDMYLKTVCIQALLKKCGYPEFDAYYVSGDMGASKSDGNLYERIRQIEGRERTFAHVGDNFISDIKNAKNHGFKPFYYN